LAASKEFRGRGLGKVENKNVLHVENDMRCESNPLRGVGNMDTVPVKPECKVSCCAKPAVIPLMGQSLCLDHFLDRCYERLDLIEPMVRSRALEATESMAAGAFLEECSNRALLVSLRQEHLSNLERSRLLHILLLAGDLQVHLRKPLLKHMDSVPDVSAIFFGKVSIESKNKEDQKDH
jgi:hypothetical protein